ncbi:MAG: CidA/LrgA family protein [Neisseriaceae bacterium]|nr:CidA/LrgA family protein [Neisseriaceae bacterium]
MKSYLTTAFLYLRAVAILCLFLYLGQWGKRLGVPLPDTIIAMLLLFLALLVRLVPEHWVAPACNLLGRYMALLFVPVSVGLMVNYPAIKQALLPLIVACTASSAMILLFVGSTIEWQEKNAQMRPMKKKNAFKKEHKNV